MSVALPLVFYAFLTAKGTARTLCMACPPVFGALALAVVDAEGLTLGIGAAMMVLACHKDFDTQKMRRGAVVGVMFFCLGRLDALDAPVGLHPGRYLAAGQFGEVTLALPLGLACLPIWAGLLAGRAGAGRKSPSACWAGC